MTKFMSFYAQVWYWKVRPSDVQCAFDILRLYPLVKISWKTRVIWIKIKNNPNYIQENESENVICKLADILSPHFTDLFKCIFLNENVWITTKISLKFVPKIPINNIPALVQIMAWCRQATSHYLNQWWYDYQSIYASLDLSELMWCILSEDVPKMWSTPHTKLPCITVAAEWLK